MRYYIVDDEIGVVKTLENIIQKRLDGTVDGYETNPAEARREILQIKPDVLLVDFLMTEMDGVNSHAAIAAMALDKPAIVGAAHATDLLRSGTTVKLDGVRGAIFSVSAPSAEK